MRDANDINTEQRNMVYYNQLLNEERHKKTKTRKKSKSFGSQKVDFKEHLFIPDNWEFLAYTFYIVAVPYIVGAFFLFFVIAKANFANFELLNMSAFPIVWAIGYEIVAIIMLLWILSLYLRYEDE